MAGDRTYYAERKSVPQLQAEQRALEAAHRARGGGDAVLALSPQGSGTLQVLFPTDDRPSPRAQQLAEAVRAVDTEGACVATMAALDEALELRSITAREWGRLLAATGEVALTRGWMTKAGCQELDALVRLRLAPAGRA